MIAGVRDIEKIAELFDLSQVYRNKDEFNIDHIKTKCKELMEK